VMILLNTPDISFVLLGLTKRAASPATSGILDILDVITGHPQAIASRIGIPKPSYSEG